MSEKTFTMSDVKVNNGKNGAPTWIVIKNSVYDVTGYLEEHPAGREVLDDCAGTDATKAFNSTGHSVDAINIMKKFKIGELVKENILNSTSTECAKEFSNSNKKEKRRIKLFFCM